MARIQIFEDPIPGLTCYDRATKFYVIQSIRGSPRDYHAPEL